MLRELCQKGWVSVKPPRDTDEPSVIGRYNGEKVKAGFKIDEKSNADEVLHNVYRTGTYNVELKIDYEIGRGMVKVEEANDYD